MKLLRPTRQTWTKTTWQTLRGWAPGGTRFRAAGAKLFFLPKYSPDLNPIEQVFAKLKHLLRKRAARTVEAVSAAIGQILKAFTRQECANYFEKCRIRTNLISFRSSRSQRVSRSYRSTIARSHETPTCSSASVNLDTQST